MAPDTVRALFCEMLGDTCLVTQCGSPENLNLHHHYFESLRSHISKAVVVIKEYYSAFVHCEGFRSYIMRYCIRNLELKV
jgi:hypothetical protein